jgi:hypothetical protein
LVKTDVLDKKERISDIFIQFPFLLTDDIRELNGHADEEIKRQRLHYGSDQLYSVSFELNF